ncbi:hypothetical protein ACJX0J_026397, partial [Zea mays]
ETLSAKTVNLTSELATFPSLGNCFLRILSQVAYLLHLSTFYKLHKETYTFHAYQYLHSAVFFMWEIYIEHSDEKHAGFSLDKNIVETVEAGKDRTLLHLSAVIWLGQSTARALGEIGHKNTT